MGLFGKKNRFTGHWKRATVREIYRPSATQHLTYIYPPPPTHTHRLHCDPFKIDTPQEHIQRHAHTLWPPRSVNLQSSCRPQGPAQFQLCCDRTQEACAALGGSIKSNGIFFYFRRRFRSGQRCFTQTFKTAPFEEGISKNKSLHSSGPHRET